MLKDYFLSLAILNKLNVDNVFNVLKKNIRLETYNLKTDDSY